MNFILIIRTIKMSEQNTDILERKKEYINQKICQVILEILFDKKFDPIRPNFLKFIKNRNLELDCYNASVNIALEYNGPTHYKITPYLNTTEEVLQYQKSKDLFKLTKCKEMGILLLVVMDYDFFRKKIREKKDIIIKMLAENNIYFSDTIKQKLYDTDVENIVNIHKNNLIVTKQIIINALELRNYILEDETINIISSMRDFNVICYFGHTYITSLDQLYTHNNAMRGCTVCTKEYISELIHEQNIILNKNHLVILEVFKNGMTTYYCNICKIIIKQLYDNKYIKCSDCIIPQIQFIEFIYTDIILSSISNSELLRKYEARNEIIKNINQYGFIVTSPYYNKKTAITLLCNKKDCDYDCDVVPDNFDKQKCFNCENNKKCDIFNVKLLQKELECINYYEGEFKCLKLNCEYTWFGDKNHIKNKEGGCPKCNGVAKLIKEDYHKVASDNHGKWIEEELAGSKMITTWQCVNNHTFTKNIQDARTYWFCIKCKPPNNYPELVMEQVNKYTGSLLITPLKEIITGISLINIKCPHKEWICQTRSITKNKAWKCFDCKKIYKK